jgi:hypothetical protein
VSLHLASRAVIGYNDIGWLDHEDLPEGVDGLLEVAVIDEDETSARKINNGEFLPVHEAEGF